MVTSIQWKKFAGILRLDRPNRLAFLQEIPQDGLSMMTLLMLDPAPISDYSGALVDQAFVRFSNLGGDGDPLTVRGIKALAGGSGAQILHVVS